MATTLASSSEDGHHCEVDFTAKQIANDNGNNLDDDSDDDMEKGEAALSSASLSPPHSSLFSPPLSSATREQHTSFQESSPQAPKRRESLKMRMQSSSLFSLKCILLIIFVIVAIVAIVTTYFVLRQKEYSLFSRQFTEVVEVISSSFEQSTCQRHEFANELSNYLSGIDDIYDYNDNATSVRMIDEVKTNQPPMNWDSLVSNILKESLKPGMVVGYSPILKSREEYETWEGYADAAAAVAADNVAFRVDETITLDGESLNVHDTNSFLSPTGTGFNLRTIINDNSKFNWKDIGIKNVDISEVKVTRNEPRQDHHEVEYIVPFWYVSAESEKGEDETESSHSNNNNNNNNINNNNNKSTSTSPSIGTSFYKSNQMKEEKRKEPLEQLIRENLNGQGYHFTNNNKNAMNNYYSRILDDAKPRSILYHPVFKTTALTFEDSWNATVQKQNASSILVIGVVSIEFDWEIEFDLDPLSFITHGIYLKLKNSVGQTYYFLVNKTGVVLLEEDDLPKGYNDKESPEFCLSFPFPCSGESFEDNPNSKYQDERHKIEYCILLYPTAEFKNHYITYDPVWFSIAAALLCVINGMLFLFYDFIVQRRQKQNMSTAEQSNAVVNSLFPPGFRDRLFNHQDPIDDILTTTNCTNTNATIESNKGGSGLFQSLQSSSPADAPPADAVAEPMLSNNEVAQSQLNKKRRISFKEIIRQASEKDINKRCSSIKSSASCSSKKSIKSKQFEPPKAKLKNFLSETGVNVVGGDAKRKSLDNSLNNKLILRNGATEPIADFFPHTTVMFADISGFTAWSSEREPVQVFCLLERVFLEFDALLNIYNVFKVETIGDCYVAVTGLPEPSKDHAVRLSRFASECILVMHNACQRLEAQLGPGTGDLTLRVGLHSGSVTAGVLRGQKLRFQLFGDTVNTAARMESHSRDNMILCSQATADFLTTAGKSNWLTARDDHIQVKGKGPLQTYWCRPTRKLPPISDHRSSLLLRTSSMSSVRSLASIDSEYSSHNSSALNSSQFSDQGRARDWGNTSINCFIPTRIPREEKRRCRETQLINWNVKILATSLEKVVARRRALEQRQGSPSDSNRKQHSLPTPSHCNGTDEKNCSCQEYEYNETGEIAPFKEVTEIIELCRFDRNIGDHDTSFSNYQSSEDSLLNDTILNQLRDFVTRIAKMYKDVPFHNLEHASHVTMSASKLMNRIVTPEGIDFYQNDEDEDEDDDEEEDEALKEYALKLAENVHYSTFGISSDPLAQFAIIFSALVHDVDHTGLSNAQLVQKKTDIAIKYDGVSVAEQNSVALAWNLLMEPSFSDLRQTMFTTPRECSRFRRLVVNTVMATDIIDKELKSLRNNRWKKAFHEIGNLQDHDDSSEESDTILNRKATIVIEHIIQASDVAHTMQHWQVFTRWNEKLFMERYRAFLNGMEAEDPSLKWYESEMGFFDFYIIPLAYKLKECGVFGVSCDEYLGFALENRLEWEVKGVQIVKDMLNRAKSICMVPDENENETESE